MKPDEMMSWLLRTALNGVLPDYPSLFGNLNISPVILRIDSFPVHIQIAKFGTNREPSSPEPPPPSPSPARLIVEDPQSGKVLAKSAKAEVETRGPELLHERHERDPRHVQLYPAPVRYRLYPHLVFDERGRGQGEHELEIAPQVKVIVFGDVGYVDFTTFEAARGKQRIHFDRNGQRKPMGIGLDVMDPFGREGKTTPNNQRCIRWSFKAFPRGTASSVGSEHGSATRSPVLVTVDKHVYDAAWLLTRQDWRKGVIKQHFLLLREREGEENHEV